VEPQANVHRKDRDIEKKKKKKSKGERMSVCDVCSGAVIRVRQPARVMGVSGGSGEGSGVMARRPDEAAGKTGGKSSGEDSASFEVDERVEGGVDEMIRFAVAREARERGRGRGGVGGGEVVQERMVVVMVCP